MYHVLSVAGYYQYSADLEFVRAQYEIIKRQLAYNRSLVDPTRGLLITNAGGDGRDWDFYDGGKPGAVTAYNAIYYKALTDAAYSRASSASAPSDAAATWQADSAAGRARRPTSSSASTRRCSTPRAASTGSPTATTATRRATPSRRTPTPRRSCGTSRPASARAGILSWLRSNLWGTFGPQPYSPEANYSTVISPFITGKEVDARFHAGDTKGAIDLIHLMWDQMVNENGPYYTGAVWEKLNQDGTDVDANASLAHGWGSGPVSSLSHYVAGARPVTAGYKTWIVDPQPGELEWAQATLPTPHGGLVSRWVRGEGNRSFKLTVAAPAGTSGTVRVPAARPLAHGRDGRRRGVAGRPRRRRRERGRARRRGGVQRRHRHAHVRVRHRDHDAPGHGRRHGAGDVVADARRAGDVRRVHAGRGEGVHGVDDRERHLHRG